MRAIVFFFVLVSHAVTAQEYYVAKTGKDTQPGTAKKPFLTISKAAEVAQPGSTIIVRQGTYRERINPPRGGASDENRIVYRAAEGEKVVIKGSEVINDWVRFKGNVWKATIPNDFFGVFNPYKELIKGDWFSDNGRDHHLGEVYLNEVSLFEVALLEKVLNPVRNASAVYPDRTLYTWYVESDDVHTYIYANFQGVNPNEELVEINVRKACFYPDHTGIDYITIDGFRMMHAATQWAPPTAEQVGLIGTNWSKGWIIQNNVISDSKCSGITLGKDRASGQNIWSDNPSIDGATHYSQLISKVLQPPYNWSKETVGSHTVRNNTIFNCEQTGICGSMGCAFSTIEGNHIYDIWNKRQFSGAEIAGIKFHGPIDAIIRDNRIHGGLKGIWLDWMTQGTQVTGNLIYDIYSEDLFVEVNHGPFLVDNNLLLSNNVGLLDGSEGGAYVHNLIVGKIVIVQQERSTPWNQPHGTQVWGTAITKNADNRFFNNAFYAIPDSITAITPNNWWAKRGSYGLGVYNGYFPMYVEGNAYFNEAEIFDNEKNALHALNNDLLVNLDDRGEEVFLTLRIPNRPPPETGIITSEKLGRAKVSDALFENPDESPIVIDYDYFGKQRNMKNPTIGPFEGLTPGTIEIKVWPKE